MSRSWDIDVDPDVPFTSDQLQAVDDWWQQEVCWLRPCYDGHCQLCGGVAERRADATLER